MYKVVPNTRSLMAAVTLAAAALMMSQGAQAKSPVAAKIDAVQTTVDVYGHLLPGTEDPVMAALDAMQSAVDADVIEFRR